MPSRGALGALKRSGPEQKMATVASTQRGSAKEPRMCLLQRKLLKTATRYDSVHLNIFTIVVGAFEAAGGLRFFDK